MTEIEKLYRNAVGKQSYCTANDCLDMSKCEGCYSCKRMYLPFTAEKQLELVKFCFEKYRLLGKTRVTGDRCVIYNLRFPDDYPDYIDCATWEETIAGLINKLWQNLDDNERQQIKEILNG